jgi:hypothetical protein
MPISKIETDSLASGLVAPTATALTTASGSAPSYSARAWVNFNGTGTVAIRASGNVSSITDQAVGKYSINMTTALPDANFSFSASSGSNGSNPNAYVTGPDGDYTLSTSSFAINVRNDGASLVDQSWVNVTVFR